MGTGHTVSVRSQEQGSAWGGEAAPACCPPGSPFLTPPALGCSGCPLSPPGHQAVPLLSLGLMAVPFVWVPRDASSVCLQGQHQTILILTAVPTTQPSPAAPCGAVCA